MMARFQPSQPAPMLGIWKMSIGFFSLFIYFHFFHLLPTLNSSTSVGGKLVWVTLLF